METKDVGRPMGRILPNLLLGKLLSLQLVGGAREGGD